jgi:hypothetical protein
MEASLRSPFTSLVVCALGSSGENLSFDIGRSGRRRRHRRFPLGGVAFGGPVFRLLVLAHVALHLLRRLGVCVALGPVWRLERRLRTFSSLHWCRLWSIG